ncbi:ShlB/FhaC/HecB family hemolysin secretion/activation protein [Stutzerimonas kirkiae]|uniref:ShlB/FhaC/HecB family hemolysin secretion/activation protein n=1 Tax=Stutzerimonas kirkiae TaxID=2211392 RepID=UPI00103839BE|nr:ShlB/FhaC/HecB family hemolysin secretion/activation protein [Stutzerimonas kirkiae]TBV06836.1 ShlB family hemolysin secretion/activation protein [Stutzerimonas kirkiae]TBV09607.1 ShlB family hemolysin secretion/activation protein [Stutzerimonas kirkiae]
MRLLLYVALLLISSGAFCAEPSPGDLDWIRERQERLLEQQRQRLRELQQLPGGRVEQQPATPAGDEACYPIRSIRLQGADLLDAQQQRTLVAPFEGRCLGISQLNELLKIVTQHYLDRGYVTSRAYLPEQDLGSGELTLQIVEGRLEGLDSSALASERELAMAFPGRLDDHLNLRELEQLVDQLGRLPSRPAQLDLLPGERVGGSRVRLSGEPLKPWRGVLSRHNDGQSSTGVQQWGVGLEWDSPLGLADQISLRGSGDAVSDHWRHSSSQAASYSLPYGWWSFDYSYNQSYYRTRAETSGYLFESDGESKQHQARAERVLHRDSFSKTAFSLGLAHLRTRNYIENSLLETSSNRLTEFQAGFNHGRRLNNAFLNLDLGWQRGSGALDAQRDERAQGSQPVSRYNKYSLTLSYLQPLHFFGQALSFDSLFNAQRSEDVLYSPQRISLGGLASVRGFKEQSLSGDSGYYWRNQLRWRQAVGWAPLRPLVQEYGLALAYDRGAIAGNRHNMGQHGQLSGHAVELSLRGQHLSASLTFAHSLERPAAIERGERPVHFRLDVLF